MGSPVVSVVVPIFNVEAFLDECLASLAAQTLADIEVICVNDGSTDGSRQIIQRYVDGDSRFSAIDKANSGYGDSINQGIERARGEWVTILESDDFIEPQAYERMVACGERHGVPLVKADFFLHWTMGGYVRRFNWCERSLSGLVWPECEREVFFRKPSIWSAIYRKELLDEGEVRCLPTPGASYQDAGFNFRALAQARTCYLMNEAFVHYRQDNEGSSVNSPAKVFCVCDEYQGMLDYLAAHPELPDWLLPTTCRMRYDTYLWNYDRLAPEFRPAFLDRMRSDFMAEDKAGYADPTLFAPGAWRHRAFIIQEPEIFEPMHDLVLDGSSGKQETLRKYLDAGGPALAARAFARSITDRITA